MRTRSLRVCFCILGLVMLMSERALTQTAMPIPPGHIAANRATQNAENVEAPSARMQKVTAGQVLQQADELVTLAQQVRLDAEHAMQGLLAKDVKDKLKRIEKLSKRLREELTP
jgi:hypothetical protein